MVLLLLLLMLLLFDGCCWPVVLHDWLWVLMGDAAVVARLPLVRRSGCTAVDCKCFCCGCRWAIVVSVFMVEVCRCCLFVCVSGGLCA